MLPSVLKNLFWGSQETAEADQVEVKHTTREEAGDWLLISCSNSCADSSCGNSNSQCDLDSVCSDSSWVVTPAPTFKRSTGPAQQDEVPHPLEDLLIEHPTMSVYRQNSSNSDNDGAENVNRENMDAEVVDEGNEELNQNRELVLLQNQQRQQLAAHMQIPLAPPRKKVSPPRNGSDHPPKLTRRALKRHNPMSRQGGKYQVQKCSFKAGRRRC